jgi:hypothetical protein
MQKTLHQISGTLAQLVEQRTFNPFVVGSTPARPTTEFGLKNPEKGLSNEAFCLFHGAVDEWFKSHAWKACVG